MSPSEENIEVVGTFDLTPAPQTLAMVGELPLSQVHCLAEFIDNSVDGFLKAKRNGAPIIHPAIFIDLPTENNPAARITIEDNGPGMSPEILQKAIKLGWSSNNPHTNLGLFGMGFNVAMSKLGHVATIWTTTKDDKFWNGAEINIKNVISANNYATNHQRRPKEILGRSGTRIEITEIKQAQLDWFSKRNNRSILKNRLAEIYSTMLRDDGQPIAFKLNMMDHAIKVKKHCVWGNPEDGSEERMVTFKGLQVSAYQPINVPLENLKYCDFCWAWLNTEIDKCKFCKKEETVSLRPRKIHGWLGVQRYCHKNKFGIDFIRNGRKIEIANKDLFYWEHPEDGRIDEYPIEDLRIGGRIVGEIHLDHCMVHYTKNYFEKSDPHWSEMIKILRSEGPLLPRKRTQYGFGENYSPLYRLVGAFKRLVPQRSSVVQGSYINVLGIKDNKKAMEYAKEFDSNNPEFQSDEKWFQIIEEQEQEIIPADDEDSIPPDDDSPPDDDTEEKPPTRHLVRALSKVYRSDVVSKSWEVNTYDVEIDDPKLENDKAWAFEWDQVQGKWCFYYNPNHEIFNSKTLRPSDALLAYLSDKAVQFAESHQVFTDVFCEFRNRYDPNKLEGSIIAASATELLDNICKGFSGNTNKEENKSLYEELDDDAKTRIMEKIAKKNKFLDHVIENGDFLKYCERKTLLEFFEKNIELYFDGKFWTLNYSTLNRGDAGADTLLQRKEILKEYRGLILDVIWLEGEGHYVVEQGSRVRLIKALCSIDILKSRLA